MKTYVVPSVSNACLVTLNDLEQDYGRQLCSPIPTETHGCLADHDAFLVSLDFSIE